MLGNFFGLKYCPGDVFRAMSTTVFILGKLLVVGSIHGMLDVGYLEDDVETFFCSSVPSSLLV